MSDPLRTYADLYHQAIECRRRLDAIVGIVRRAAEALDKRPEHFRFDEVDGVALPPARSPAFADAAAWPTAAQIQQALADWHMTAIRLTEAWEALWPRDRELLARSSPESANIPLTASNPRG